MTPLERLLQEEVPVRPERADGTHSLWTEQEQDRHWDDLCRAVGAPNHRKHPRRKPRPASTGEAAA
jgi:hypothetical protein